MQRKMCVQGAASGLLAALILFGLSARLPAKAQIILVPTNAVWKYLDDGTDQGTAWRAPAFDDDDWMSGPAELGFGDTADGRPEATMINSGPAGNVWVTHYFRHRFQATNVAVLSNLQARVMRDDGAVVYLNGTEAGRTGMPAGTVNYLTLAAMPGASGADEYSFFPMTVASSLLVEGENVLAVEVHQNARTSSDLSFALELVVNTNPPPTFDGALIVPAGIENSNMPFGDGTLRAANYRSQQAYGAIHFPFAGALAIRELRFRPDSMFGGEFDTTISSIQINLSTTPRSPDGLSVTFAQNVGPDDTVVYSGSLPMSSDFTGPPGGPKDFDMSVRLQTPFTYDPGAGNLLLEIRSFSGSTASALGGQVVGGDSASRLGGSLASPNGTPDTGIIALQILSTLTNAPPRPTRLVRGPYLQRGTTTNMMVLWRTSVATNSLVRFGLNSNALTWEVRDASLVSDHYMMLTNLAPDTMYFYSVGAYDTNFAGGPSHVFVTAPASAKPTRVWAIGDFGTTGIYGDGALAVRDAYYDFAGDRYTDVWLMLGDNAYSDGRDFEFQRGLFDVYGELLRQTPPWSTIGNHETYGSNTVGHIPYYDIFRFPTAGEAGGMPSGTLKYYSFNYGNIHFVCLDSEFSDQTAAGPMATWLQADLEANTNDWLIAFWHSPPYTKGSHNSDNDDDTDGHLKNMREIFVPILETHGVDLVLGGHSHNYERSYLVDGHYGYSHTFGPSMLKDNGSGRIGDTGPYLKPTRGPGANEGALYIVNGSSGFVGHATGTKHPIFHTQILQMGSLILDIDGNRLDGTFLRETGAIGDFFTIIKGGLFIERIQVANGQMTAWFKTLAGHNYRIESSPSLETPVWTDFSGPISGTGAIVTWSGGVSPDAPKRFYRAVQID